MTPDADAILAEILKKNPHIEPARVKEYLAYEKAMREQGADIKPTYRVASPLGRLTGEPKSQPTSSVQKMPAR